MFKENSVNTGKRDFGYPFAIKRTNAYISPASARRQRVTDPKATIKGARHVPWESVLNNMLGRQGFLNDDEYNLWKKGGY
jgi:hypothetical protein